MVMAYTKLDAGITDSTIWQAPDATRLVWITMLAMSDQNGYVGASMPGLAGRARVALDACVTAIETLESPDEWSRTKEHDGRRIAPADGGWVLLNHAKYRAMQSADDRRERSRIAMAELRAKRKLSSTPVNGEHSLTKLTERSSKLSQAEAEAEAEYIEASPLVVRDDENSVPACPFDALLNAYHANCPSMPKVRVQTNMRMKHARARWMQVCIKEKWSASEALDWFAWFFAHAEKSDFLAGRKSNGGRVWKADFGWLMNSENFAKVIEGNYHGGCV